MNTRKTFAALLIAVLTLLLGCSGPDPAAEAQKAAVSFAETVAQKAPSDYRPALKGNLRAVDVFLQTYAVEYEAVNRPGESWQQIHGVLHEQGHPLAMYDSSWTAQTRLDGGEAAEVVLSSGGKSIKLRMVKDQGAWKVDWQKVDPFLGIQKAR